MAPFYANIFMARLEQRILATALIKPLIWWHYIDDIFAILNHGKEALVQLVEELNHTHPTIKFTAEWSHENIPFLDTLVSLKDGAITTDQYLAANSCHP